MNRVGICNMAIGHLGSSMFIGSIDERSTEARVCRTFFDNARDRVLSEIPWGFAKSYADLQDIGSPPAQWLYRYRYPADCLFVRAVTPKGYAPQLEDYFNPALLEWLNRDGFEVIEDEAGGGLAICTNTAEASITYTKRITNEALFPVLFCDALGWGLGMDIGPALTSVAKMVETAREMYRSTLLNAAARSMNESKENFLNKESEFIAARG